MTTLTQIIGSEIGNERRDDASNYNANNNPNIVNPILLAEEVTKRLILEERQREMDARNATFAESQNLDEKINASVTKDWPYYATPLPPLFEFHETWQDFRDDLITSVNAFEERLFLYVSHTSVANKRNEFIGNTVSKNLFYFYVFRSMIETEENVIPQLVHLKKSIFSETLKFSEYDLLLSTNPANYDVPHFKFILREQPLNPIFDQFVGSQGIFKKRFDEEIAKIEDGRSPHYRIIPLHLGNYESSHCQGLIPNITSYKKNLFVQFKYKEYSNHNFIVQNSDNKT